MSCNNHFPSKTQPHDVCTHSYKLPPSNKGRLGLYWRSFTYLVIPEIQEPKTTSARTGTWTLDPQIKSLMLYRLSYTTTPTFHQPKSSEHGDTESRWSWVWGQQHLSYKWDPVSKAEKIDHPCFRKPEKQIWKMCSCHQSWRWLISTVALFTMNQPPPPLLPPHLGAGMVFDIRTRRWLQANVEFRLQN